MPKFMLVLRGDTTTDWSSITPEDMQRIIQDYQSWAAKLAQKGLLHDGKKLTDAGGKVLRADGKGGVKVTDGPYQETKEVVGGFYVITAESYDHAVELCRDQPNLRFGTIEIREVDFMGKPEE